MEVLLWERVNDLCHRLFHLFNCLITTASELREYPKVTGSKVWSVGRVMNCLDDPSWLNSLWQGWSCGLVHCPAGNATDPIWRVLASSDRISSWTPLKPQHSNPNTNPNSLANQLWCIDFFTPSTPLITPDRISFATQNLILDSCKKVEKQSEAF